MRDGGGAVLGHERAGIEAVDREGRGDLARLVLGDESGEDVAGAGRRLPAAGAPAAVDVEALHRRLRDDRARVRARVDDAAPLAHHPQPRDGRQKLAERGHLVLDDVHRAALRVGIVGVDARADDEFALVGLAAIDMHRVRHDDAGHERLDRLGDERLQRMALDRQLDVDHRGDHALVWPAVTHATFGVLDEAARSSRRRSPRPSRCLMPGHLALLDDVDAHRARTRAHSPTPPRRAGWCRRSAAASRRAPDSGCRARC